MAVHRYRRLISADYFFGLFIRAIPMRLEGPPGISPVIVKGVFMSSSNAN